MANRIDIKAHAAAELNAAASALQQAHLLFTLIESTIAAGGELTQAKTLAHIGAELACNYGNRAEDEAAGFEESDRA
ncbi:hypothetical protein WQE_04872 [Paraburkholderia hospita]|uniref:Uncharacterized protein n=1 Tax=Paraburkholderia hospita TaxID=169430 RepID=A0ABN0FTW7_9BURK|nr:hypothetical protein [Paraburkholderia hospita]EIN02293.1 hypothetical protein WQE_04872 [Paraburkholderia hospita]OUL72645.1 hypothetical protein CA602_42950 [Paraburkholderia hospita]